MAIVTEEYQKKVLDDINDYITFSHPVRASFWERLFVKKLAIHKLHPNPTDEFSMPEIGPNYGIVSKYESHFRECIMLCHEPFSGIAEDPLMVEKMSTGGYMILNGHHRWIAATRVSQIKKIPVNVINVTPIDTIIEAIKKSDKNMCVSFDLDEVLLSSENQAVPFPLRLFFKKNLRKNAVSLIHALQENGFDVWVYSGDYSSEPYINALLALHHVKVTGIVSGIRNKKTAQKLRQAFQGKYKASVHVDTQMVVCVNTQTKAYETYDITSDEKNWATDAFTKIKSDKHIESIIHENTKLFSQK